MMDGLVLGWLLLLSAIALGIWLIYLLMKKAAKDALREYEKERRQQEKSGIDSSEMK
ncbi:MAG: hypothetical protein ACOX6P_00570 [Candidatus Merdivicinus sp.]|jgi:uncharacterized membrane protein YdjX (TVP38/TMEM64 family)